MTRTATALLLLACCSAPLSAQAPIESGEGAGESAGLPVVAAAEGDTAAPPARGDRPMKGKPLDERIVGGAVVGAVTGGVLSSQGSDCAPAESPVEASFFGAILGAIRGAFGWDVSEDPAPQSDGNGASEAPFPFEGRECEAENSQ